MLHAIHGFPQFFSDLTGRTRSYIVLVLFATILMPLSVMATIEIKDAAIQNRMSESKHLIEASVSAVRFYYDEFKTGVLTEDQAKKSAYGMLNQFSYNNGQNYIFAYSYDKPKEAVLRVNLLRPDLVGQNRWDSKDINGIYYNQALIAVAKNGGGFVQYMWDAGGKSPQPRAKLSYASAFEPWSLMIGTGQYVDDIISQWWDNVSFVIALFGFILAMGSSLIDWLYQKVS